LNHCDRRLAIVRSDIVDIASNAIGIINANQVAIIVNAENKLAAIGKKKRHHTPAIPGAWCHLSRRINHPAALVRQSRVNSSNWSCRPD
jgi:hypothetical protein